MVFNPFHMGGMVQCTTLLAFFLTQKVLKISSSIFPTFKRMELSIFCQKIKVLGLTWAFLQPFCDLTLKIPKQKNAILGGKEQLQNNGQLYLFYSSHKNTHVHQISSLQVKKCLHSCINKFFGKCWPKKVLGSIFVARGLIFQPILKIPF